MARAQSWVCPVEPRGLQYTTAKPAEAHSWNSSNQWRLYCDIGPPWTLSSAGTFVAGSVRSTPSGATIHASIVPAPSAHGTGKGSAGIAGTAVWNVVPTSLIGRSSPSEVRTNTSATRVGVEAEQAIVPSTASNCSMARSPPTTTAGGPPATGTSYTCTAP